MRVGTFLQRVTCDEIMKHLKWNLSKKPTTW